MLELYELIYNILNPICETYAEHYPISKGKIYPYVEFSFQYTMPNNTYSDNNLLYVDIWNDKSGSVAEIEDIAHSVEKTLNRLQFNNDKVQVCISKNNPFRFPVPDTDVNIQRRELRFIVKTYYK